MATRIHLCKKFSDGWSFPVWWWVRWTRKSLAQSDHSVQMPGAPPTTHTLLPYSVAKQSRRLPPFHQMFLGLQSLESLGIGCATMRLQRFTEQVTTQRFSSTGFGRGRHAVFGSASCMLSDRCHKAKSRMSKSFADLSALVPIALAFRCRRRFRRLCKPLYLESTAQSAIYHL